MTTTTPAGVEGPPTAPPAGPSPGSPCWVDVNPYPFGSEGIPVETSAQPAQTCSQAFKGEPPGSQCALTVTSMAFRAWNRGLAATDTGQGSGAGCEQSLRSLALQRRLLVPESRLSGLQRLPGPHSRVGGQARLLADWGPDRPELEPSLPIRRRNARMGVASNCRKQRWHMGGRRKKPQTWRDHLGRLLRLERLLVLRHLRHRRALGRHTLERCISVPTAELASGRIHRRGRPRRSQGNPFGVAVSATSRTLRARIGKRNPARTRRSAPARDATSQAEGPSRRSRSRRRRAHRPTIPTGPTSSRSTSTPRARAGWPATPPGLRVWSRARIPARLSQPPSAALPTRAGIDLRGKHDLHGHIGTPFHLHTPRLQRRRTCQLLPVVLDRGHPGRRRSACGREPAPPQGRAGGRPKRKAGR